MFWWMFSKGSSLLGHLKTFKWITSIQSEVKQLILPQSREVQRHSDLPLRSKLHRVQAQNPAGQHQILRRNTELLPQGSGTMVQTVRSKENNTAKSVKSEGWLTSERFYPFRPFVQRWLEVIPVRVTRGWMSQLGPRLSLCVRLLARSVRQSPLLRLTGLM